MPGAPAGAAAGVLSAAFTAAVHARPGRGGAGGQQASADPRNGIAFGSAPRRFPFLPVQTGTATPDPAIYAAANARS
jgi:hypothetical protein